MKTIKNLKAEEIRKSILQLAIQGKLVKQDSNDEPASELVKRIYAEKQKLIQEGKIKKDKNESFIFKGDDNCYYEKIGKNEPVKLEDLPFDIPENWTWVRLKSLFEIRNGFTPLRSEAKYWEKGTINWFTVEDIHNQGHIITSTVVKINKCACTEDRIVPASSLLLCCTASIGEYALTTIPLTTNQQFNGLSLNEYSRSAFNISYLLAIAPWFKSILLKLAGTTTFPFVSTKKLENVAIPLPPINEQTRIVNKINSFEPLIAKYSLTEEKLTKLEQEFPEKLKKSILQYAIEGKLVKQDPNDEPASVLLERIKAEKEKLIKEGKIKRDKNESYIYQGDDKNYYENLPLNWVRAYVKNVISLTSGNDLTLEKYSPNNIGVPYLTGASNIAEDNSIIINRYTTINYVNSHVDEILLTCKGTIGKIAINTIGDIHVARQFMSIRSFIPNDFMVIYLKTIISSLNLEAKSMIPGIDRNQILSKAISLPPIREQIKIANKTKKILHQIIG